MNTIYIKNLTIMQMINDLKFCLYLIRKHFIKSLYKIQAQTKINIRMLRDELLILLYSGNSKVVLTIEDYTRYVNRVTKFVNECQKLSV